MGFNLSVSRSLARDVPGMVKRLVRRIRATIPDWRNVWKIVTILVGHNDLCNYTCPNTLMRDLGMDKNTDISSKVGWWGNVVRDCSAVHSALVQFTFR